MAIFEMNLISLKKSIRSVFSNRERLYKMTATMIIVIFLETFEYTYSLILIESFAYNESLIPSVGNYWNLVEISSVRYISGFVHHVPLLNIIPGQGAGITDAVLDWTTTGIIGYAHDDILDLKIINDLSDESTFVLRFFNFYLKKIIAILVTLFFIPKVILKKGGNKNEN